MVAHIDVELTFKAIKRLLASSEEANQVERLHIYSTIKALCDSLESTIKNEKLWDGDFNGLITELLCACGAIAGIHHELNFDSLSLAQSTLDSFESGYLSHKQRG